MRMPGQMKAYVEAYGCTLNFGEAREVEALLRGRGWDLVERPDDADLVVLVTCVVIETTERAMLKRIKELSDARRLIVTGCMATACREKAERLVPSAQFIAPGDLPAFSGIIDDAKPGSVARSPSSRSYGIVPIATGCVGACSYCITRLARGELRSRDPDGIIESVRREVSSGPREIQLTAQDTAAYGADIGSDLPLLVDGICRLSGDFRLRIGMMNPKSVLPISERVARMYLDPKVFKFLHLPLQSASDRLLEHMERGYLASDFRRIVLKVRGAVPNLTLSTDIIVGYPGESDSDHRRNLNMLSEIRPDIVNITRFSPRPGTKAAYADGKVVGWKAKERSRELTELRFKIAHELNTKWVGKRVRALATEMGKKGGTILRNDEYKQIVVQDMLPLGRYFAVEIEGATPTHLIGKRADG
jgi:threonylcarbamoyladenosine tRNA methylthiotransferase CDKAL1